MIFLLNKLVVQELPEPAMISLCSITFFFMILSSCSLNSWKLLLQQYLRATTKVYIQLRYRKNIRLFWTYNLLPLYDDS